MCLYWSLLTGRALINIVEVRFPLELHVVHRKVGVADPLNTAKGLAVTGFFFEVDGDNDNSGLAPLTDALEQIITSDSQLDFNTVTFSVRLIEIKNC